MTNKAVLDDKARKHARRLATARMAKCACGNVAALGQTECGWCRHEAAKLATEPDGLEKLAERVEREGASNELDVLVELALFKPSRIYTAIRANNAGTKVIYTDAAGNHVTCWATDWTGPELRGAALTALRSKETRDEQ